MTGQMINIATNVSDWEKNQHRQVHVIGHFVCQGQIFCIHECWEAGGKYTCPHRKTGRAIAHEKNIVECIDFARTMLKNKKGFDYSKFPAIN